jgi:hypothetical protein
MTLNRAAYLRALKVWSAALVVGLVVVVLLAFLTGCQPADDGPSDASKSADVKVHDRLGRHAPTPVQMPEWKPPLSDQDT